MVSKRVESVVAAFALALSLCLAAPSGEAAAAPPVPGLHAELSQQRVHEGETVRLLLRQTGGADAPELGPLTRDFEILDTRRSQRVQIVNGSVDASLDWVVTLRPLRTGDIEIPALRAGDTTSTPLRLAVSDAPPPPQRADTPDLFVEAAVDEATPFVQGEVHYRVRVFDGIGMIEGALTEPESADLRIEPVGEAHRYETEVNGRRYHVHEREYLVAPLKSGELTIPAVSLEARVPDPGRRAAHPGSLFEELLGEDPFAGLPSAFGGSFFDRAFDRGRAVRVRSNAVPLTVRPRPAGAGDGWFLPARDVQLAESFSPESARFTVGEAVRRTITLRALGAAPEQLPRIELPNVDGVRLYDEGFRTGTAPSDGGTVSVLEQTIGILPTEPGAVELPAVEIEWFDTASGEKRVARLPARTIEVSPAAGGAPAARADRTELPAAGASNARQAAERSEAASPDAESAPPERPTAAPADLPTGFPGWVLLPAVALAFAAGLGATRLWRRRRAAPAPAAARPPQLAREIRRACDASDPRAARAALIHWGQTRWPGAGLLTPGTIARRLESPRLTAAIAELERTIYSSGGEPWQGTELWQAFREASARGAEPLARPGLRALYPDLSPGA